MFLSDGAGVSLGNLPSQINSSSSIRIWIPNSDDDYDTISISMTILSQQSRFRSNFDLFLIKIDYFGSLFQLNWIRIDHSLI